MKKVLLLVFSIFGLLIIVCTNTNQVSFENQPYKITAVSSIKSTENCDLSEHGLDCDIVKGLEENLASAYRPSGVDFCSYEILDVQGNDYYLQALCEEYYPQNKKIICPDEESTKACFGDEKQECKGLCDIQEIEPYLATGSGISGPVKLTITEEGFTLWKPRDGSYYAKDLQENLTREAYDKLDEVDVLNLRAINIDRAENYFGVKVSFEDM